MSSDMFLIDMPNFVPNYKENKKYAYKGKGGENLKSALIEASKGYCMYCYTKILVDRKNFGQLEHSIEKFNCDKLVNCPANISITCSKCNGSFKKKGERIRQLTKEEVENYEAFSECNVTCIDTCDRYNELRKVYNAKKEGEIILQPFGIRNNKTQNIYLVQYDILEQKFIPSNAYPYTDTEKEFIRKHINRFNLNDHEYRTKEFLYFIEDVIEYNAIPKKNRYCNLVVDLFIEKVHNLPKEKAVKICNIIYTHLVIKNKN